MTEFKIGDIITGVSECHDYSYTNDKALLLVTSITSVEHMRVKILCINSYGSEVGNSYEVCNSKRCFTYTTMEEYLSKYPECYSMDKWEMEKLIDKYAEKVKEEVYVLSDETRKELLEEMKALLKTYHYHPTDDGLNAILDEWCANKANLIRMFETHPNYNGKFQIAFDYDFDRKFDQESVNAFYNWLCSDVVQNAFKAEVQIGEYNYSEVRRLRRKFDKYTYIFAEHSNYKVETINGMTHDECYANYIKYRKLTDEYQLSDEIVCEGDKAYDAKLYRNIHKITNFVDIMGCRNVLSQTVGSEAKEYFDKYFPEAKIGDGMKMSRAVNKILSMLGVDKIPDYNKEFAKFSDAINPLKIKRHTVISVHPVDYLTMSFGNSWSSCQTIDKENDRGIDSDHSWHGSSSSGVMSYMLDTTSCMFYTVDADYNGNALELEDKINRNMFHYYDNRLIQGRVYPQSNDSGANDLYRDIREIVQKIFADMLGVPNYWTYKPGRSNCCEATISTGTHYRDYENFETCSLSVLKDDRNAHKYIRIGHYPICPCCGTEHDRSDVIECCDCY